MPNQTVQRYRIEGKIKPNVRANKRFSKDPKAKEQYNQYRLCLENVTSQAWVQRQQQGAYMIEKNRPLSVIIHYFLPPAGQYVSDLDNMTKTVYDAFSGVVYEDDRYIIISAQYKMVVAEGKEPYTLVTVMDLTLGEQT